VRLVELIEAGDTVLLVPPGTEGYVQRIASPVRPFRLPGFMEQLAAMSAEDRAQIRGELESGEPSAALLALAPLFERHEPARVAAALYELWRRVRSGADATGARQEVRVSGRQEATLAFAGPTAQSGAPTAKIWVSVGKREGVTPADLVGALTRELKVDRGGIGRIELRDGFSLVELPAADAERIAEALTGKSIRRVRVTARLDRGQTGGGDRPAFRERSGGERPVRRGGGRPRP
jgi:ATP-dependent RNA helicase DeaD